MNDDQFEALAVAHGLARLGAERGAAQILFNIGLQAQRQPAEVRDLSQRPAFGRRNKSAEKLHAANDHLPAPSERPAPPVA